MHRASCILHDLSSDSFASSFIVSRIKEQRASQIFWGDSSWGFQLSAKTSIFCLTIRSSRMSSPSRSIERHMWYNLSKSDLELRTILDRSFKIPDRWYLHTPLAKRNLEDEDHLVPKCTMLEIPWKQGNRCQSNPIQSYEYWCKRAVAMSAKRILNKANPAGYDRMCWIR